MDEFFDQLKQNLESRPSPAYKSGSWERMEQKLRQAQRRDRALLPWWWIAAGVVLLLALGAGNIIQAGQLSKAREQLGSEQQTENLRVDTIYRERIVVQRDTILIDRESTWLEQTALANRAYESTNEQSNPRASTDDVAPELPARMDVPVTTLNMDQSGNSRDIMSDPTTDKQEGQLNTSNRSGNAVPEQRTIWAFGSLQGKGWTSLLLPKRDVPVHAPPFGQGIVVKKKRSLREFLRPDAFEVGAYLESNTTLLSDVVSQGGYGTGAELTLYFSPRWQVWAGYHYMQLRYRALQMGDDVGIPVVSSPLENFEFTETDVTIPAWQLNAGVTYQFRLDQYRPYLGIGISTSHILERALIYRFEDADLDLDLSIRYEIPGNEFAQEQLLMRAGLDYVIGRHWSLNIEGSYRTAVDSDSDRTLNILGIRSGLYYIF